MKSLIAAGCSVVLGLTGCASSSSGSSTSLPQPQVADDAPLAPKASPIRTVKSRDGRFEGEIVGTVIPGSRFSRLQIGMTMEEVQSKIGSGDGVVRHETGKRWIPFYYGNDAQRVQVRYRNEGCLTYTAGNVFGGGGSELIRITAIPRGNCME